MLPSLKQNVAIQGDPAAPGICIMASRLAVLPRSTIHNIATIAANPNEITAIPVTTTLRTRNTEGENRITTLAKHNGVSAKVTPIILGRSRHTQENAGALSYSYGSRPDDPEAVLY